MSSVLKQASILKVFLRIMLVIQGQNTCPYVSCREETKQTEISPEKFQLPRSHLAGNSIHMVKLFFSFCFFFFFFFLGGGGQRVAPSSSVSIRCKLARRVTILSLVFISSVRLHGRT